MQPVNSPARVFRGAPGRRMAHPPRAPLVVLPEASGFPDEFAAPWTANREWEDATDAPNGTAGDPRGHVSVSSGSRRVPVRPLPRPLVPCASETATASPSSTSRDVDSEVGAHPDTLRSLNLMHGDLVTITERVGGETRVGTIVAAMRWARRGESLDKIEDERDAHASAEKERERNHEQNQDDVSDRRDCEDVTVRPGFLYLPPALRRNLRLHVHFAAASAAATLAAAGRAEDDASLSDASRGERRESTVAVTVTVARLARTSLRRCASIAVAPARIPKPAVPGVTPSFASPDAERASALEAAVAEHFRSADRLLAVGDVFAATAVVPVDAATAMARSRSNRAAPLPRARGVVALFVVTAAEAEAPSAEKTPKTPKTRRIVSSSDTNASGASTHGSLLVSADRTKCAMVAAAAAGAPSAREAAMFAGAVDDDDDDEADATDARLRAEPDEPGEPGAPGYFTQPSFRASTSPLLWRDGGGASLAALVAALAPAAHPATARAFKLTSVAAALVGRRGVGKRSVARAAAEALHLAIVEVNCFELLADAGGGGAPARTVSALEAAFDAAGGVGPALLYLRRFDALCAARGDDAGDGGNGLARALRKCVARFAYGNAANDDTRRARREDAEASERGAAYRAARGDDDDGNDDDDDDDAGGFAKGGGPVFLVAGVDDPARVPEAVRARFTHEVPLRAPGEPWRLEALREALLVDARAARDGSETAAAAREATLRAALEAAAGAISGATPREVRALASRVGAEAFAAVSGRDAASKGAEPGSLEPSIDAALKWSEGRVNAAFGAPAVPNTTWDDVGGLEEVKAAIRDVVERPLKRAAEARAARATRDARSSAPEASGTRAQPPPRFGGRSGALLYGPPGTGKTLLAKAVATECATRFLSVKGPELINMYVGESERNVREVFERARGAAPCVVFFDELDALAPARGKGTDGGGVMDRVVSQLSAELDACVALAPTASAPDPRAMVFAFGATNRPDLVDPALLRPGRFDRLLYVGIDSSVEGRARVLAAMTKRFVFAPLGTGAGGDEDEASRGTVAADGTRARARASATPRERSALLARVARRVPATFTGADLYALCADAWMRAAKRAVASAGLGASSDPDAEDRAPVAAVAPADFALALEALTPSLTDEEVARYARMRADFEGGRRAPAGE